MPLAAARPNGPRLAAAADDGAVRRLSSAKGLPRALGELAKLIEPPPLDPHWNRGLAMAWEQCEDGERSKVEHHWRAYLDDLAGMECLSPPQRTMAQALVWLRLGKWLVEESCPVCPDCGVCHETGQADAAPSGGLLPEQPEAGPRLVGRLPGVGQGLRGMGPAAAGRGRSTGGWSNASRRTSTPCCS